MGNQGTSHSMLSQGLGRPIPKGRENITWVWAEKGKSWLEAGSLSHGRRKEAGSTNQRFQSRSSKVDAPGHHLKDASSSLNRDVLLLKDFYFYK